MKVFLTISFLLFSTMISQAQIYLNLEFPNKAATIKYGEGQILRFRHADFPDTWRKERIERIDPEEQLIILENDIVALDQILAIQEYNRWAAFLSGSLYTFSVQWIVIGGIAAIALDYNLSIRDAIIPLVTAGSGFLIRKFFLTDVYKVGRNCRLRIVDLRMSVD